MRNPLKQRLTVDQHVDIALAIRALQEVLCPVTNGAAITPQVRKDIAALEIVLRNLKGHLDTDLQQTAIRGGCDPRGLARRLYYYGGPQATRAHSQELLQGDLFAAWNDDFTRREAK